MSSTPMDVHRVDIEGVTLWWTAMYEPFLRPLSHHHGANEDLCHPTRREAENEAIRRLVVYAFDEGASKRNRLDGSPYILLPDDRILDCSISHSPDIAALAIPANPAGPVRLGIDIESTARVAQLTRVAARFLSPIELTAYADCLLKAWTLKEALYKAARIAGLDFRRDIRLPLPPGSGTAHVLDVPYRTVALPLPGALLSIGMGDE